MRAEFTNNEIHLKDYIDVLRKRLWTVVTFFVIVVTVVAIHTFTSKPVYEAVSKILIEKENPNIVSFEEVLNLDTAHADYFNTQYKVLKSRTLVRKVFKAAGLGGTAEYRDNIDPITAFSDSLKVKPVRDSRIVSLAVSGHSPEKITEIANLWAKIYMDQNLSQKLATSSQAVEGLSEKVENLQGKVNSSELALQSYKEESNIIAIEERQGIVVQKLSELNSAVIGANRQRIRFETRFGQLSDLLVKKGWQSLTNIVDNNLIQNLKSDLVGLEREEASLSLTYRPKHPKMATVLSQMKLLRSRLAEEVEKVVKKAENDFEVARLEEETLRKALEAQKREALDLNKKLIRYNVLKREVDGNQKLFDVLLNRLKETSLTEGLEFNNIRVMDYAEVPMRPVRPKKRQNLLLALIVGLMGGAGLAFFFEYLDDSIKSPEDVERLVDLPFLGLVPAVADKESKDLYLVTRDIPKSPVSEAFRGLRTAVLFSASSDRELKTIMVTSSGPSEGKTTTAVNLAVTMAQGGKRVLLVDSDLRKPSLHKIFGISEMVGASNLLVDQSMDVREAIHETGIENLDVITCGPIPPNPSELLGSRRMKEIIERLHTDYDRVIFDTPPVMSVTDANVLGRMVEGVVLVVNSKISARKAVLGSKRALMEVGANVIGIALNQVDMRDRGYYSYSYEYSAESA